SRYWAVFTSNVPVTVIDPPPPTLANVALKDPANRFAVTEEMVIVPTSAWVPPYPIPAPLTNTDTLRSGTVTGCSGSVPAPSTGPAVSETVYLSVPAVTPISEVPPPMPTIVAP